MIGILTEKPSAGRNFAKALGGNSGSYNGEQYVIVSARGHLYEYDEPDKQVSSALQAKYKSWSLAGLPWDARDIAWKRVKIKDTASVLNNIKSVLSSCSEVVIATDVDPTGEGELLAWEILDELNIRNKKFTRMYFTDESEKEIQKAFVNRKVIPSMRQDVDFLKAEYRAQWDYCSQQFTRIATICVRNAGVIRQGRLKSVMVKIVGDGLKAVKDYKPVPFYVAKFKDDHGVVYTSPDEKKYPDKNQVPMNFNDSPVVGDSVTLKHKGPPRLIDLATLSSRLAAKGMKAKAVLATYQSMYEAQVVSYPRTEDKVITPEQFNDLLPKIDKIARVVGVNPSLLTRRTPRSTHVKVGGAHGANRPGPSVPNSLSELSQFDAKGAAGCAAMIYDILAKSYLAMLCPDYEYEEQRGHVKLYPSFVGVASVPKVMGWKSVFSDDEPDDDTNNDLGLGSVAKPYVHEGVNTPPPTPTMKWLMKQLEKNDVGTGATRTSTYADVTNEKTKYPLLIEKRGKLSMSNFGEMSYILLDGTYIGDVKTTERLMQEMRDVASGKFSPSDGLRQIQDMVKHDMEVMKANTSKLPAELGAKPFEKDMYTGIWQGREVSFNRDWSGYHFSDSECEALCNSDTIELIGCVSRTNGSKFNCKGKLSEQTYKGAKFVGFEMDKEASSGMNENKVDRERYSGTWNGSAVQFNREWSGHRFTDEECEALCRGEEISLLDCKSSKGKDFKCKGKLSKQNYNGHSYVGFERTAWINDGNFAPKIPDTWCKHKFTEDEKILLERGDRIFIENCTSAAGKHFSCYVTYGKTDRGTMGICPDFGNN